MTERARPWRLKHGANWATTYALLENARDAARKLPSGTHWKIERQLTRYGKRELIEEGVTP